MGKKPQALKFSRQFSAGGVVFKNTPKKTFWLVTRSTPSKEFPNGFWRLPKGWIDNRKEDIPGPIASGEKKATEKELREAAVREVREESGVIAGIISKLGSFKYFLILKNKKILKFVTFYLMEYLSKSKDGHDWETSEVSWLEFDKAYKILSFSSEKKILKTGKEMLEKPGQESLV